MVIDARHMSDLQDVRSYRGGNVDFDHHLVIARMRARISNIKKIRGERTGKFCISKLQDENMTSIYAICTVLPTKTPTICTVIITPP
jgi:hypothetical protein